MKTKYFFDTEFIENGKTIDLISIGMVCEDGRSLYLQNEECEFRQAGDWVWRNVFPLLDHFAMQGKRSCQSIQGTLSMSSDPKCYAHKPENKCPWRQRWGIRDEVLEFMNVEKYGNPEVWAYYGAYDWVALCQLFGSMIELPKGFPMCHMDVKQLCNSVGNPKLPAHVIPEHHALNDARWTADAYKFLSGIK